MSYISKDQELSDCNKAGKSGSTKLETREVCGYRGLSLTKSSIIVRPVTIDSLWSDYSNFLTGGGKIWNAMKYNNVVNVALITSQELQKVLD